MNAYEFILKMKNYASSEIQRVSQELGVVDRRAAQASGSLETLNSKSSGLGRTWSGLVGIAGGLFAAVSVFAGVQGLFNIGVQAEQANVKFEVLLGSVDKANKMLGELTTYADKTPYSFKGLQQGAETMLGFGVAEEKILPNMKMLGDVAMGNDEKLSSLSLVYSQISATGKLMGQDLLQLINSGFNPLQIISEKTGISMGDLKKKMEAGAISSDMVTEAFRIATSEGGRYYGMTEKMAESAGGKWSTMMDTFANVSKVVGLRFVEWIKPLFDIGTAFASQIIPFGKWVYGFLPNMNTFVTIMQILGIAALAVGTYMLVANASTIAWSVSLGILNGIIWLVEAAQWAWNFAMNMNPIGIVIALVVALAATVVVLWQKFGWFRGAVLGVWEVLKGLGMVIKNYVINRFQEVISGLSSIGQAFIAFINGDYKTALASAKKAGSDLLGFGSKDKLLKDGKEAFSSFNKGWEEGMKPAATPKKTVVKSEEKKAGGNSTKSTIFDSLLNAGGGEGSAGKGAKGKGGNFAKDNKPDAIVSGGSRQTQINITIQKLNEKIEVHTTNLKEGGAEIEQKMQEFLLRAVNSVNQMQTT